MGNLSSVAAGSGSSTDVRRALPWYLARLRAMSPREVAWRAGSSVLLRMRPLGPGPVAPPTWRGPWSVRLRTLVESRRAELVDAAARIADGQLELWGRSVEPGARSEAHGRRSWDRKVLWELQRQQHLFPLAAGASLARRSDWARICCEQLLDWIERNPRSGWESGYETAHRLVGWAWAVPLVIDAFTEAELARVSRSYAEQAAFTASRPSRYSSANNHRLAELTGLLAADACGLSVDWTNVWSELEEQVALQTYSDGGSREQASGYFLYVLEILWVAGVFAKATGRGLGALEERLRSMLRWLEAVSDAEGEPPPLGDDAEDRMLRIEYFEPRRAAAIAGRVSALLDGDLEPAGAMPSIRRDSVVLPESGLAVFRGGGNRVVVDVGELGFGKLAAHGHPDALSVLVDREATPLLRDSGTCAYAPREPRERHRATFAHNTVVVDGRNQARALGPHIWGRRFTVTIEAYDLRPELDYIRASHDGYRPVVHTRSVTFLKPNVVVVLDRIAGRRECEATLVWQRPPDAREVGLSVASRPAAAHADADGPFSPRYTWCMEAPRSTWSARGQEVIFASLISLGAVAHELSAEHELGETVVEVAGQRLVERWHGGPIEVQA